MIELFASGIEPERPTIWRDTAQAMRTWVTQFLVEEEGQDVVEYSLLLVLMGTVILIFLSGIGVSVTSIFSKIGSKLEQVSAEIR
ncbi:MAG: Flp family type IVb pilin [Blastocatellia bacterium]